MVAAAGAVPGNQPAVMDAEVRARLMPFHCFFDPDAELDAVLETFARTRGRSFLEVGTHKGFTSAAIAATFPRARVVTLDLPDSMRTIWNPLPREQVGAAYRAIGVADRIEQHFLNSAELWRFAAAEEFFDVIFIDGDHSEDSVFRDLILAADLLAREGGVLLAHDYTDVHEPQRPGWTLGVQAAVDRFLHVRPFRKVRLPGLLVKLERSGSGPGC
jgi:predicted O-methyltransferase YrrM